MEEEQETDKHDSEVPYISIKSLNTHKFKRKGYTELRTNCQIHVHQKIEKKWMMAFCHDFLTLKYFSE